MTEDHEKKAAGASRFAAIYAFVRTIPAGKVVSYGEVGQAVGETARTVGWAMSYVPADVPWHRVVGADGYLRIARRAAELAAEQRKRLESEGAQFDDKNCIKAAYFWDGRRNLGV